MNGFSVAPGPTLSLTVFLISVVSVVIDIIPSIRRKTINKFAYRSIIYKDPLESYGTVLGFIYASLFSEEFELLNRIQSQLETKDQDFTSLKLAYIENCKNTGVAAAIIASVALTALSQLPEITNIHWAAHLFFLISLVASLLSLYFGTKILVALGNLSRPRETRDWFTKSNVPGLGRSAENILYSMRHRPDIPGPYSSVWIGAVTAFLTSLVFQTSTRKPSFSTALLLVAPSQLLGQSAKAFVAGLGVYLVCIYTKNLTITSGTGGSLALLVVFLAFTSWKLLLHYLPFSVKNRRNDRLARWKTLLLDSLERGDMGGTGVQLHNLKETIKLLREWIQDEPVSEDQREKNTVKLSSDRAGEASPVVSASAGDRRGENASSDQPSANTATSTIMATTTPPPIGTPAPDLESLLKAAVEAQQRSAQTLEALLRAYQKNSSTAASAATTAMSHEQQSAPHTEDASNEHHQGD